MTVKLSHHALLRARERGTTREEIEDAFATMVRERPGALLVLADRLFLYHRERIMDFATKHRLPEPDAE